MMIDLLIAAGAAAQLPAFLTGCWSTSTAEGWTQECWMQPRAGIMLGGSRQGKGDKLNMWEWMNVQEAADGNITFRASPKGAPGATFKAEQATATSITFVNAANDYPQRIRYSIEDGRLEAEISKLDGSDRVRWTFQRDPAP
jgi:hypothetical protein